MPEQETTPIEMFGVGTELMRAAETSMTQARETEERPASYALRVARGVTNKPEAPPARAIVYEVTCAEDGCGFAARGVFEEFAVGGWVLVPVAGEPSRWFCPACVHGMKRVAVVTSQQQQ
jgi:hypothetical protein